MPKVDWNYHRTGCKTCSRATEFLAQENVTIAEQIDAKKIALLPEQALQLVSQAHQLYVTKGSKVIHVDLKKQRPDDETLLGLLIGPSGTLRAPTLKIGKTLVVGFDQATYEHVFR